MNLFDETGVMAIGSRLRMLSERVTEDSRKIYAAYNVDIRPKWFPVIFILSGKGTSSVTELASEMGHSHPSVVKIVKEMIRENVISEEPDPSDGRKVLLSLTERGRTIARRIAHPCRDAESALESLFANATHNLWAAMEEFEYLLDRSSLYNRVMEQKKEREAAQVQLINYAPEYRDAFRELNEEWIIKYFKMEDSDRKALEEPEKYILDPGGDIVIALLDNEPVGVCALIKMEDPDYDYELAKMAVSPAAQGHGIGYKLGEAIKTLAKDKGGKTLYLESNTVLTPAINLYRKLGFEEVSGHNTPYSRCNIQMSLNL